MVVDFMNLNMQRVATIKAQDEVQAFQLFLSSKYNKYNDLILQSDNMCIQVIKDGKVIVKILNEEEMQERINWTKDYLNKE